MSVLTKLAEFDPTCEIVATILVALTVIRLELNLRLE